MAQAKANAMGDVLDRSRLDRGWNVYDDDTQAAQMASFFAVLDPEGVPFTAYGTLYNLFMGTRARARQAGKEPPDFGPDAMLACWLGENGLAKEWGKHPANTGPKLLSVQAPTQCTKCQGTGMEQMYDTDGRYLGRRKGCNHDSIDDSKPSSDGLEAAAARLKGDDNFSSPLALVQHLQLLAASEIPKTGGDPAAFDKAWEACRILSRVKAHVKADPENNAN